MVSYQGHVSSSDINKFVMICKKKKLEKNVVHLFFYLRIINKDGERTQAPS